MKAFGLCLPYCGRTKILCFLSSQNQFYQSYWVENYSARLFSHTSWEKDLPKLITTSSYKLECFHRFMKISSFFENYTSGSYQDWKRRIVLKISHAVPRVARRTAISPKLVSDYWMIFRYGTGFPYHRVSIDTIFQRFTLLHGAELSSSLCQQRCTK